ncbi:MAG: autotransporter-associated beta strand repeat-containing protein [Verrucomicrobiales bacterium]|nr:autotransporter-associated beta strand repeat-containing protein [Verrucomicrobiales bacterium]
MRGDKAGGLTFDTNSHDVTISETLSGVGGLTKTGAGTLMLNAASNSYSGTTQVSTGTLLLNASVDAADLLLSGGILSLGDEVAQTFAKLTVSGDVAIELGNAQLRRQQRHRLERRHAESRL